MKRRHILAAFPGLLAMRTLLDAAGGGSSRLGICSFSCHQHWKAANEKYEGARFSDPVSFYDYARSLGSGGVQTSLRGSEEAARAMRERIERDGCYYEAEVKLPKSSSDLANFEKEVRLALSAGAGVARAVFTSGRRYEVFESREEFLDFNRLAGVSLELAEPVLRRHRLKVAIENHKDHTVEELVDLMSLVESEWIGVLVDTGNNIALLEEPHGVVEALAPYALSVHLKDMAVEEMEEGFFLSEVPLGT